ncbi:hypothetical protein BT96DRAFT_993342 [Gymnopus androsaceus JB14]|uniref:Uncharacterized protein n=1 Tax=Gymnopus androsaceus JB14 TaxID=1447944 RepID=A0A6A4HNX7_9AGAR|nr:hypothetical protein BT96DRAFT_999029 [Gymnopus androsaceus JB14]KAE9400169.1 hypothetical protein BT96DRAFT_993342 [Gymnopus androsaceus JB14]
MGNNKGGHPRKQKRNTTSLKNQQNISAPQKTTQQPTENPDIPKVENPATQSKEDESSGDHWIPEDSVRAAEYFGYETCDDSEDEEEDLKQGEWDDEVLEDENLQDALLRYAAAIDDEIYDESWVPEDLLAERLQKRKQRCREREHKVLGIPKKTFQEAKDAVFKNLDACPVDVIRRKAAEWAVRKQKMHRSVSANAMMHLDAICPSTT